MGQLHQQSKRRRFCRPLNTVSPPHPPANLLERQRTMLAWPRSLDGLMSFLIHRPEMGVTGDLWVLGERLPDSTTNCSLHREKHRTEDIRIMRIESEQVWCLL